MKRMKYITVLFLAVLLSSLLFGCGKSGEETTEAAVVVVPEAQEIGNICDLSTMEIYYHDVTKLEKNRDNFFWTSTSEVWVEYYANVKVGVKGEDVSIDIDSDNNVVTVKLPNPEILDVKVDEGSLTKDSFFSQKEGLLAPDITQEEIVLAMGEAEEQMRKEAAADGALMNQAKQRTETTIRKYIENLNDVMDTNYSIRFEYPPSQGITTDSTSQ